MKSEREEDTLEILYQWYCWDEELSLERIRRHFQMTKRECSGYIRRMMRHGYLTEQEDERRVTLTETGKVRGAECLHRHRFLQLGDSFEHIFREINLICRYETGEYEFSMGIYEMEARYPRILAKEFSFYTGTIRLWVSEEQSVFILQEKEVNGKSLWYQRTGKWIKAQRTEDGNLIPTEAFTFCVGHGGLFLDGELLIAFCDSEAVPEEKDCRELDVHVW